VAAAILEGLGVTNDAIHDAARRLFGAAGPGSTSCRRCRGRPPTRSTRPPGMRSPPP
jgi:hypothetical protein